MPRVHKTRHALTDLDDIWWHIARDNLPAADRFVRLVDEKLNILAEFPLMGVSREAFAPGLRGFSVGEYMIYYRPIEDGVRAERVLHGALDKEALPWE